MAKRAARSRHDPLTTPIISTIARPIATKELLARLLALSDHLSAADQNDASTDQLKAVAGDLASKKLLKHSNKGVLAYACCALADILRLYAPDAPYSTDQLSAIFKAFFAQFAQLSDDLNPYFLQHCYLLKRLVEVRLIILVVDLPDAPQLISDLFDTMYLLASKGFPAKLEPLASEMLAEVVSEAELVPQKVVSLMLKKLTATGESGLTSTSSNISNPGLAFSLAVCEANVDKMSRQLAQLFSEMLDESANARSKDNSNYEQSYLALEKIHTWSTQIWKYVPDLLTSVMGLINDELNSDSERVRMLATTTIGNMVGNSQEGTPESNLVHFINTHKNTWVNWLKKSSDMSPLVRAKWVEQVPGILCSQSVTSDLTTDLGSGLIKCLSDTNEKVRFAACKAIEGLPFVVFTSKVCTKQSLTTLLQLIREKNADIHNVTIQILANTYDSYLNLLDREEVVDFGNMNEADVHEVEKLLKTDLPNALLQLNYVNDKSLTATIDIALFEKLVPFSEESLVRVSRLCRFYSALDDKSKAAFFAIVTRQKKFSDAVTKLTDLVIEYSKANSLDGENKENEFVPSQEKQQLNTKIEKINQWLVASMPQGINSYECLERFVQMRNGRLLKLMAKCVSPNTDFKSVKNSLKELLNKLGDAKAIKVDSEKSTVSTADMVLTMKILLYRASNIFFNKTNTSELVKLSKSENGAFQQNAHELINRLSSIFPDVFKTQVKALADLIVIRKEESEVSLIQSFSNFMKKYPDLLPEDEEFTETLTTMASEGSPRQARYAVKIIGRSDRKELLLSNLVEKILPLDISSPHFATHLSSLAEIYLIEPIVLEQHSNDISSIIVEEVLRKNRLDDVSDEITKSDKWIEDDQLYECKPQLRPLVEKIISIRLIMNRVRSAVKDEMETLEVTTVGEKPLKLLTTIVSNYGEIVKSKPELLPTPVCFQQRLRLEAGLSILKMAKYPGLNTLVNGNVISALTKLLHDNCAGVREKFLKSLERHLSHQSISERFLHLVFFMGHEPVESVKNQALTWVASNHRRCEEKGDIIYERILARLIHAIAHEERFTKKISEVKEDPVKLEVDAYVYALSYLAMYLTSIAKEENISLLYYIASRVKQYRDAQVDQDLYSLDELPDSVINLYRATELSQLMIKEYADLKGWTLQTWPGKMKLPSDLFAAMEDYKEAQKIVSTIYISDDVQIELRQNLKKNPARISQKRKAAPGGQKQPQAKKLKSKVQPKSKKPRKQTIDEDDEDDIESTPATPIRRSSRARGNVSYAEAKGSDDEVESDDIDDEDLIDDSDAD